MQHPEEEKHHLGMSDQASDQCIGSQVISELIIRIALAVYKSRKWPRAAVSLVRVSAVSHTSLTFWCSEDFVEHR